MAKQAFQGPPAGDRQEPGAWYRVIGRGLVAFAKAIWYGKDEEPDELTVAVGEEPPLLEYSRLDRWFTIFTKWMSYVAAAALGVITLVCFVDVVAWKFFGWTLPSATALITHLNLVLVFLAAAYVQMSKGSVAIELIQSKFPRRAKLGTRIFASVLGASICFFAGYRGWYRLVDMYSRNAIAEGVWHFRLWPFQAVLVFGFGCLGLAFLFTIGREITNYKKQRANYALISGEKTPSCSGQATEGRG